MLRIYRDENGAIASSPELNLPGEVIWIDLLNPSPDELAFVESRVRFKIPSRAALSEIEASSRLIAKGNTLYLSTPIVAGGGTRDAALSPAGFVLTPSLLVTIRYAEFGAVTKVQDNVSENETITNSQGVFSALLEAIVEGGADALERLGAETDSISRSTFRNSAAEDAPIHTTQELRSVLTKIGSIGDHLSVARDVLLGVARIASFAVDMGHDWITAEFRVRLEAVRKDVASLNDYETQLANKVQFLLDAVLGYISIQQNEVFKVLTIASVVGIPPTVIAGIWGMNFQNMPELHWQLGYPLALLTIVLSGALPLLWFKMRGWF